MMRLKAKMISHGSVDQAKRIREVDGLQRGRLALVVDLSCDYTSLARDFVLLLPDQGGVATEAFESARWTTFARGSHS